ncbi:DUF192 domain-containing protein [Sagittula salina]|uniref:DUF192 domain-containing protein n=1 Tax=Sagittula salina TaxID=2820268 RepID=A0A940MLP0_9RHOB|nr:DUF192 domain-containing protein [Sagittula salina]MBP0482040.1 DUF192 domain-containing protein [Sagittula salina]
MLALAGLLLACLLPVVAVAEACAPDTVQLRGESGESRFTVDLAVTPEERNRGLMFVEKMATSKGMLFVYETPQPVAFWMKNTLIPLDMIFADEHGVVQNVHASAVPGDLTPIPGKGRIKYVLEINGGLAAMLHIAPGTVLRHPLIENPAWPCE